MQKLAKFIIADNDGMGPELFAAKTFLQENVPSSLNLIMFENLSDMNLPTIIAFSTPYLRRCHLISHCSDADITTHLQHSIHQFKSPMKSVQRSANLLLGHPCIKVTVAAKIILKDTAVINILQLILLKKGQ